MVNFNDSKCLCVDKERQADRKREKEGGAEFFGRWEEDTGGWH